MSNEEIEERRMVRLSMLPSLASGGGAWGEAAMARSSTMTLGNNELIRLAQNVAETSKQAEAAEAAHAEATELLERRDAERHAAYASAKAARVALIDGAKLAPGTQ